MRPSAPPLPSTLTIAKGSLFFDLYGFAVFQIVWRLGDDGISGVEASDYFDVRPARVANGDRATLGVVTSYKEYNFLRAVRAHCVLRDQNDVGDFCAGGNFF